MQVSTATVEAAVLPSAYHTMLPVHHAHQCLLQIQLLLITRWYMQESLADSQAQEQRHAAYANEIRRHAQSSTPQTNGNSIMRLQNMTGEYNCFLNVIIQCLWHCHEFRRQVMGWNQRFYEVSHPFQHLPTTLYYFCHTYNKSLGSDDTVYCQLRNIIEILRPVVAD